MSLRCLRRSVALLVTLLAAVPAAASAQTADDVAKRVVALQDSLKAEKTFQFGLSFGWRWFMGDERFRKSVAISPVDSTIVVDETDESDVVLSGVVVAYPFDEKGKTQRSVASCGRCGLGFIANLTLASLSADNLASFNRSVEGGIGLALALSNDFALGLTFERAFRRRLRNAVVPGRKLLADGQTVTTLSSDDDRFFVDDNATAVSVKFVYSF